MKLFYALTAASILALTACADKDNDNDTPNPDIEEITESGGMDVAPPQVAIVIETGTYDVINASGFEIGSVTVSDTLSGISLALDVTSIPEGSHAIHFHQHGTCDGPDFKTAGGHYNPASKDHGFDVAAGPHAGDMRNFDAPASGVVTTEISNERVSLSERKGLAPLLDSDGTALIIHAVADDYKSQPSGAAGARIACAVISN